MKITILNGNPKADNIKFDNYIDTLTDLLKSDRHTVTVFKLRDMDIKHCIGCWSCWVETPGECIIPDNSGDICREYINSDFVIFDHLLSWVLQVPFLKRRWKGYCR